MGAEKLFSIQYHSAFSRPAGNAAVLTFALTSKANENFVE
jgi:hypothetical protein